MFLSTMNHIQEYTFKITFQLLRNHYNVRTQLLCTFKAKTSLAVNLLALICPNISGLIFQIVIPIIQLMSGLVRVLEATLAGSSLLPQRHGRIHTRHSRRMVKSNRQGFRTKYLRLKTHFECIPPGSLSRPLHPILGVSS